MFRLDADFGSRFPLTAQVGNSDSDTTSTAFTSIESESVIANKNEKSLMAKTPI